MAARLVGNVSDGPVRVTVRLASPHLAAGETSSRMRLELQLESEVPQPELLAYWAPATPGRLAGRSDDLPAGSILLGPARIGGARSFDLPEAARRQEGGIVVYSLAQRHVAATVALANDPPVGREAEGVR